jgi:hypothetical protein
MISLLSYDSSVLRCTCAHLSSRRYHYYDSLTLPLRPAEAESVNPIGDTPLGHAHRVHDGRKLVSLRLRHEGQWVLRGDGYYGAMTRRVWDSMGRNFNLTIGLGYGILNYDSGFTIGGDAEDNEDSKLKSIMIPVHPSYAMPMHLFF